MGELEDIYTREWVEKDFAELEPEFRLAAKAIYRQFRPGFVWDVGCGPGFLVSALRDCGVDARGIEGSQHCIAFAAARFGSYILEWMHYADIRDLRGFTLAGMSEPKLIVCTEVAEHLDAQHADHLISLLCSAMCPIIFTAAPPGQGGHHHVNEQPPEYWRAKFAEHGVIQDYRATVELQHRWARLRRLSHMTRNVMVLDNREVNHANCCDGWRGLHRLAHHENTPRGGSSGDGVGWDLPQR